MILKEIGARKKVKEITKDYYAYFFGLIFTIVILYILFGAVYNMFFNLYMISVLVLLSILFFAFKNYFKQLYINRSKPYYLNCPYCDEYIKLCDSWTCDNCGTYNKVIYNKGIYIYENCKHCNKLQTTAFCEDCDKEFIL